MFKSEAKAKQLHLGGQAGATRTEKPLCSHAGRAASQEQAAHIGEYFHGSDAHLPHHEN